MSAERGAGAGAGAVAALAAGLVARSARGAVGVWDEAGGAAAQAEGLRRRLTSLGEENAAAYAAALAELDPARDQEGDGEERDDRIADTLTRAATVPAAIAESSGDVAELACAVAAECGADLRPDALSAAFFAEAAARAAVGLVEANLLASVNDETLKRARAAAARAAAALGRANVGPRS